ncbi:MAG: hypothetical protein DRP57_05795 [Spirochaetes bacterium]|nr:MAG: hypothetical protein DRP57_05795 [Spirochaetota bacterium]
MKKKIWWFWIILVVILAVVAIGVYVKSLSFDTTLKFNVTDAVSKEWVWNSKIQLEGRIIEGFFQKDFTFTHLRPGKAVLKIEAPSYTGKSINLNLKKGENIVDKPIYLKGYEIPGLDHFVIFTSKVEKGIKLEIRPVGKDKKAVINHPCLNIKIVTRVSEQIKNGAYVSEPTDSGSERGKELYRGEIKWNWDSTPETIFRYSAVVPVSGVRKSKASYWVLDYLLIVPDSRKIEDKELEGMVRKILSMKSIKEMTDFLDGYKGKIKYFTDTTWNEKATQ